MKSRYQRYYQELYACPSGHFPTHSINATERQGRDRKCWDGLMDPIDNDELLAAVRHMRLNTVTGPDRLVMPMVKWVATPVTLKDGKVQKALTISPVTPMIQC